VRIFLKLGIRVYVPNGSYDRIRDRLGGLSGEELSGLRRFSQIFDDLRPFTGSFQTKLL